METRKILGIVMLATLSISRGWAQPARNAAPSPPAAAPVEPADAQRTKEELSRLLDHYPPSLRNVLALDPSLLSNPAFLGAYPALVNFLNVHPEVVRAPHFYIAERFERGYRQDTSSASERTWSHLMDNLAIFAGFGMAIGLLTWLIRTWIDYRRWNRLTNIQTEVHTRLLDRFAGNEELLAYIKSTAGSKFLESSPILLDAGPRSVGAPLGRILWSVQAGLVMAAGGIGMEIVGGRVSGDAAQPIHALGVLGIALGLGFVVSAVVSYVISHRLGLIEPPASRAEPPATLG